MADMNVIHRADLTLGQGLGPAEGDRDEAKVTKSGSFGYDAKTVPDAGTDRSAKNGGSGGVQRSYSAVMGALGRMMSKTGGDALDAELAMAISKMKDVIGDVQTGKMVNDQERKRASLSEKQEKIKESQEKFEEAQQARKKAGIWNWVKIGISALASAISIAVGSALTITGVGSAVGALMIAGGSIGLAMAIDSCVQEGTGKGVMGNLVHWGATTLAGKTDEEASKMAADWDTAVAITMAVAAVVVAVATFGAGSSGIATAAQGAGKAAQETMQAIKIAGDTAEGITALGTTVTTVGQAVNEYEAATISAEGKQDQADIKSMEAMLQMLDTFIDTVFEQLQESMQSANENLATIQGSMNDHGKTMYTAKFTG